MFFTRQRNISTVSHVQILTPFGLSPGEYALATLHRPSNVDEPRALEALFDTFDWIQERLPIVLPLHPRTKKRLEEFSILEKARSMPNYKKMNFHFPQAKGVNLSRYMRQEFAFSIT